MIEHIKLAECGIPVPKVSANREIESPPKLDEVKLVVRIIRIFSVTPLLND